MKLISIFSKTTLLKGLIMIIFSLGLMLVVSCTEEEWNELLGIEDEYSVDYDDNSGGGGTTKPGYTYDYSCPASGAASTPIPAGTVECQDALEFFARTYACNDVGNFNAANCKVCIECGDLCDSCD